LARSWRYLRRSHVPGKQPPPHARKRVPSPNRRRALELLAASPDGATEAILVAHGFTIDLLVELVRAGVPTANPKRLTGRRESADTRSR
jgi:hypothetical protein